MRKLLLLTALLACNAWAATPEEISNAFDATVKTSLDVPESVAQEYLERALEQLNTAHADLDREQFLVTVDRNPSVQTLFVFLGKPATGYELVGATHISAGSTGRFDHYVTPTGVYDHKLTDYSDFRAEGTKNSNGIRGYGAKGMRIWDFGWVPAQKGWLKSRSESGDIRFQMHATDPNILEKRLGTVDSKGCVRVPAALNTFMDKYGVLDWHYEQAALKGKRPWVLRKDRVETPYSGRYMVVVDSAVKGTPDWLKGKGKTNGVAKESQGE